MKIKKKINLCLDIEVEVEGNYESAESDIPYLENGDPGYEGTAATFIANKVIWNGIDITNALSGEDYDCIAESIFYDMGDIK